MQLIIESTLQYVKKTLEGEGSGHDWWHVYRVWKNAILISKSEKVDTNIVQLGALLHDIADYKFHGGDDTVGPKVARGFLEDKKVEAYIIDHVCEIIETISFKGSKVNTNLKTLEAEVVQDADRLDAIGAIGIARTFAYGGYKNRLMYDPNIKPEVHHSFDEYKKNTSPTINHFYEKLLLLKGLMNTDTGKRVAEERHIFMENYLNRFFKEWNGEL
jgi:uncharacterized protein